MSRYTARTDRRTFLGMMGAALLAAPLAARAQQPGKMYRIGYISPAAASPSDPYLEAFVGKLRDLGYAPGQNIVIERRVGEGLVESSYAAAADLVRLKVDAIWVGGSPGALAVKRATSTIPVVF